MPSPEVLPRPPGSRPTSWRGSTRTISTCRGRCGSWRSISRNIRRSTSCMAIGWSWIARARRWHVGIFRNTIRRCCGSTILCRRRPCSGAGESGTKLGGIDTSFQFAMDWDLLLRFQEAGAKIVRLPYFLACFRVHPQQKTSALISTQGQAEIDKLRRRTFGRDITPEDLLKSKPLQRYLRKSAWIEQLWKWGIRAR